jgi:hypothetical protein
MQNKYFSFSEIDYFFQALKIGKHVEWPIIGYLLLSAEHHQIWYADSKSFTAWMREFSKEIKKQESLCWRYLAAAKFYLKLKDILIESKIECPAITALSEDVSPENVELLAKLYRVMPHDLFMNYAQRTIENNIKRKELREAWSIYRPSLQGRTARGIKFAPTINIKDEEQFNSQAEAIAIASLINSDGAWAKKMISDFYKTFRDIKLPISIDTKNYIFKPDLFVITGSREGGDIYFHIVEYSGLIRHQDIIKKLVSASKKVNYVWVMCQIESTNSFKDLPQEFGLIVLSGIDKPFVHRKATYSKVDQTCVLKELVLKTI